MRSIVIEQCGDPARVLRLREQPVPVPGPGEVRLKLILSPIHTHDLEQVRGEYGDQPPLPAIMGSEAVGLIDAIGPDVHGLELGQRVCAAGIKGAWADYCLARAGAIVPLPAAVPDTAACQMMAMPLSAAMLVYEMALQPGDWMLQNAANGAIGRIVNALAEAKGFKVVNLVRSAEAAETMIRAGMPNVLRSDAPDLAQQVRALLGEGKLLRAADSLGGDATNQLLSLLDEGGTLFSFGTAVSLTLNVHVDHLLYKQATLRGIWTSRMAAKLPGETRAGMMRDIIGLVLTGKLALPVESVFELAEAGLAAAAAVRPNRRGKIALRPSADPAGVRP